MLPVYINNEIDTYMQMSIHIDKMEALLIVVAVLISLILIVKIICDTLIQLRLIDNVEEVEIPATGKT